MKNKDNNYEISADDIYLRVEGPRLFQENSRLEASNQTFKRVKMKGVYLGSNKVKKRLKWREKLFQLRRRSSCKGSS